MHTVVRKMTGRAVVLACGMLVGYGIAMGARFEIPLKVSDGVDSSVVYFGIVPGTNFCVVETDSINGHAEYMLPPPPPSGVFDTRMVWPRTGVNAACFDQGTPYDYRPFTSATEKDTFKVKSQLGSGATMVITWPAGLSTRFQALTLRFVGSGGQVNIDMLTNTSADVTDAGDPAVVTILSNGVVGVEPPPPGAPQEFGLMQNYPNPFNPTTAIPYAIAQTARTDIAVYDILGRRVTTLKSGVLAPGNYTAQWDGTNTSGVTVASGVYFVRMSAQGEKGVSFTALRKLIYMK